MPPTEASRSLALVARLSYLETLRRRAAAFVQACGVGAKVLSGQSAEPAVYMRRRDVVLDLPISQGAWLQGLLRHIEDALGAARVGRTPPSRPAPLGAVPGEFSLVDNSVLEHDMMCARLAQTITDSTGSSYMDLCSRMSAVEPGFDAASQEARRDVLHPRMLASWVLESWLGSGLSEAHWKTLQTVVHDEAGLLAEEGYHEANRVLLERGIKPEIDLRPFIRRAKDTGVAPTAPHALPTTTGGFGGSSGGGGALGSPGGSGVSGGFTGFGGPGASGGPAGRTGATEVYEETRLMTQSPGLRRPGVPPQAVLGKLNQFVADQVPGFVATRVQSGDSRPGGATPSLLQAMNDASQRLRGPGGVAHEASPDRVLRDLHASKQALKKAASTPNERAIIEIVALLFQSILTEERLLASIRVWFARLQMPVLRVAVAEPDFFSSVDHPARALIDRMGACVMGFAAAPPDGEDALPQEIKRIVQVVEAYPDTGRRVFQTVLIEFEKFLERYFRDENEASRKGVSLAQQVEQRETMAIQYTIELRKMLQDVPVHEGIREFLFRVWADVLAHSAVLHGSANDEVTRSYKKAATDLIWSASAKVSREERANVLSRLPSLLKTLREGMTRIGMSQDKQDEQVKALNSALTAAFSARSATVSTAHLQAVTDRLESLDDILPDLDAVQLDAQTLRDLSGHESEDLEVVAEGGTMPTPAMLSWARELQIGAWFELDYRNRCEPVQFAWSGLQKQLALFVTAQGRGILFQSQRLAAFLQAGLLVPLEDESLTVRATRDALAKLDADPERLLS